MGLGRFPLRVIWAAVLLAGAVLALAPSSALAHAGHSHSHAIVAVQPAHAVKVVAAPAAKAGVARRSLTETQTVSVPSLPKAPANQTDCDGQGCCTSGPCTGYHGFVLATTAITLPSSHSTLLVTPETLPPGGADVGRLRRPPKSFA
jgi:hypothetical protein